MIEDQEMRELFRIESEEHLQRLDGNLLRLEKDPGNATLFGEAFREAHSLKGSARMLGITGIESIAHRFEDILGGATRKEVVLTPGIIDSMYGCLDAIRRLVEEAVTGAPSEVVVSEILSRLKLLPDGSRPPSVPGPSAAIPDQDGPPSPISAQAGRDAFAIDTIRVETRKLDRLMTHSGELTVAKLGVARLRAEIEEIVERWDELRGELPESCFRDAASKSGIERISLGLDRLKMSANDDSSRLEYVAGELESGIRSIRLLPLSTVFNLFPRVVRDLSREKSLEARLVIEGGETTADKRIIEELKDPLMHILRNAVDHGIEPPEERERKGKPRIGTIALRAYKTATSVVVEARDDGRGLDIESIRRCARKTGAWQDAELDAMSREQVSALIFRSGLSTSSFVSEVSGRGVGLDVVRANVERLKGTMEVDSVDGAGCAIRILLPITLTTVRVLIFTAGGVKYALPTEHLLTACPVREDALFPVEGREAFRFGDEVVSTARLPELLPVRRTDFAGKRDRSGPGERLGGETIPCIVLRAGEERLGLLVDELLDEQEIVLKTRGALLRRVHGISGTAILGTGEVCMILDPDDLIDSVRKQGVSAVTGTAPGEAKRKKLILMAEDSLTMRTRMQRILEEAGYEVVPAVDGKDAYDQLATRPFDALVSDILMPNMDGLTLTAKIRQDLKYRELPVILVTTLSSEEDKRKGVQAGANAYIAKPAFHRKVLLDTLGRFL